MSAARTANSTYLPHLAEWRRSKLLTQGELADLAGITSTAISNFERGRPASFTSVKRLAKALGIEPSQLISSEPPLRVA